MSIIWQTSADGKIRVSIFWNATKWECAFWSATSSSSLLLCVGGHIKTRKFLSMREKKKENWNSHFSFFFLLRKLVCLAQQWCTAWFCSHLVKTITQKNTFFQKWCFRKPFRKQHFTTKICLSGNTVWPEAIGLQKSPNLIFWHFSSSFVVLKFAYLVTPFDRRLRVFKNRQIGYFGIFHQVLSS